ncbi:MAG: hypothetical protein U0325_29465 [Polyangiales bacterium]
MWRCRWLLSVLAVTSTAAADPPAPPGLVALPVPGFGAAVVVEAAPRATPRPVLIAAHGNFDHPEWQCRVWARVVAGRAFVLCPRGIPRRDAPRFTYGNSVALTREIEAGLRALDARYAGRVTTSPVIYAGFSLGAILGVDYLRRGRPVSVAVLLEDSVDRWTPSLSRTFVARGGRGVLFGCGTPGCVRVARAVTARLRAAGIAAGIADGRPAGHTYWGPMLPALRGAFARLADADPRLR